MKPYANGRLTNHGTTRDGGSGSVKAAEVLRQHLEQLDVSLGPHGSSRPEQVVFEVKFMATLHSQMEQTLSK